MKNTERDGSCPNFAVTYFWMNEKASRRCLSSMSTRKRGPRVGPDLDIDVERVAALRPDLVLASLTVPGHERIVERLSRAKLPFVATEPVSVADVYADVEKVGALIDAE